MSVNEKEKKRKDRGFADRKMILRAMKESMIKMNPRTQMKNPVMFLVYVSAILTTSLWIVSLFGIQDAPGRYTLAIAVILWFTCLFANFAEAIAEGRGKAQADALRASRKDVDARRIPSAAEKDKIETVPSASLKKGNIVIVKSGEQIPADGEIIEGAASVDESAITGESAPVIREAGGDRSAVTGGTTVLSDWIIVRVTSEQGNSFMDKMIAMVEGASRKKTPNEIALEIFLIALSIIFILVTVSLYTYSIFSAKQAGIENPTSVTTLVALLVCLAPTTIGALLSAIGIAGMSRLNQANVLAMSGRAIEAAGDVDVLLLDKTGTITLGNRQASELIPVDGTEISELADAAQLSSLADETPEGKLTMIRDFQSKGHLVAMTGDGTNDAPALAQADVAVAMNSGTQAAKEAGNMVDLDSSPTKLIQIVQIGKQLLMTRGSLTTFSIANDVAKYFAIIPALFMGLYPGLSALNIMNLASPMSAVLSAIIYNALIIVALIPLALKGVKYREVSAGKLLSRNLLVYGLGGLAAPFIFIKLIDLLLAATGLV
ncbi:MAG: HAD-IC family P-type ATPase [Anaerovoracaceae bacterium]|nr:HAD-IC family P-type ATPase [Anaerovoracaceae bacterium]